MGMFDYLSCEYPLPIPEAQNLEFQTKDTDSQFLNYYKIDKDGYLWENLYDIEDKSDPNATGIERLFGYMTRVNKRWEKCNFTGEIRFYSSYDKEYKTWVEFSSYFTNGHLQILNIIKNITIDKVSNLD